MADPSKQKDAETAVAITGGILGGFGSLADAYFSSKAAKKEAAAKTPTKMLVLLI